MSVEACIHFRLIENQVVVAILLGGRGPFTSLLDVAVAPSVVDLALARELGLLIDETAPGEAAGQGAGRATFYPSELPDLQIGEHFVGSIEAVAADLASLGAKLGRPLHAILGQSFFVGRVVQFDYEQQRLKLDPTTVEEGISVPIEGAADLTPVVPVTVNGREVPVVLDTGSSLTLGIYLDAVDDLGLATARDAATPRTVTGARGEVESVRGSGRFACARSATTGACADRLPAAAGKRPDASFGESGERLPPPHHPHARLPAPAPEHPPRAHEVRIPWNQPN